MELLKQAAFVGDVILGLLLTICLIGWLASNLFETGIRHFKIYGEFVRFMCKLKNEYNTPEDNSPICPDCKSIMVKTHIEHEDGSGWFSGWGCECQYEPNKD